jgi:predicted XRE-type DNA-binding protein
MRKHTKSETNVKITVTPGSGNIFADLRLPNAPAELAKAKLVIALATEIRTQGLKQADAAHKLGLTQPKISKLLRGDTSGFSTDKILSLLTRFGKDVKIEVTRAAARTAVGHVEVHAPVYAAAGKKR